MKRRGFVIMACSERSRHSRPYSARNKWRTLVSRERIELGMQQVKQPLFPFYSNEIPFRRDFLKVSYFFTNYTKEKKKKKLGQNFESKVQYSLGNSLPYGKIKKKEKKRKVKRINHGHANVDEERRANEGEACQPFNSCGFNSRIRNNVSRPWFNYDRSSERANYSTARPRTRH